MGETTGGEAEAEARCEPGVICDWPETWVETFGRWGLEY